MGSPFRVRRIFKPLVVGIAKIFSKGGIFPNHITLLMLITSIIACILIIFTDFFWVFGILTFIVGILDGVDGALARLTGKTTTFGAFFDSNMDRLSEIFLFLGLFLNSHYFLYGYMLHQIMILSILLGSLMISYVRSRAENISDTDYDVGVFARSERLFLLFLICIIPFQIVYSIGIILLAFGVITTMVYRIGYISRDLLKIHKE
ncbi:MAG: CDP-alcohol phosphatidyltransferase family protein [Candidatus Lokiarchaeota archaeon]|nr:CDP-alcohol phosphatidyltransferase family protein [Candidatus Lokiarchaeota archaeon]